MKPYNPIAPSRNRVIFSRRVVFSCFQSILMIQKKSRDLDSQKGQLNAQKARLEDKISEYDKLTAQVNSELENLAGMTAEQAKKMLVENMKAEARSEAQAYINDTMDEARLNASKEAKRFNITAHRTSLFPGKETTARKQA